MEGMPFTLFKLDKNAQCSSDPGGKCWNPAFSESYLGLFNGYVWIAQKNVVHKIVLESHSEVFHAFCMQVNKCDVIYTVLLNKDYVGE